MKKKYILFTLLLSYCCAVHTQTITWEERAPLPERITNNALATATVGGIPYVFSFAGIDSTKACGHTHLKSFRYDTQLDFWEPIAPLPDPMGGKIAAGASTVKNKIYIVGGYHVDSNCGEISSDKIHIYDPETNAYLPDGAPLLKAIDDHVQAVWRDSLIFVVTGWSNTTNVTNVQIYNPATDVWTAGTPVPNANDWRVFGGSGEIIGDTIYYIGGASPQCNLNVCFPPTSYLRKGVINPSNPAEITWEGQADPAAQGYRMGATTADNTIIWLGGSDLTYNFNGIDYNGTGGVAPTGRVTLLNANSGFLSQLEGQIPAIMDLRGVAKISESTFIIAGGMEANQVVTNKVFQINIDDLTAIVEPNIATQLIFPNPVSDVLRFSRAGNFSVEILDSQGKTVLPKQAIHHQALNVKNLDSGIYFIRIFDKNKVIDFQKIIKI